MLDEKLIRETEKVAAEWNGKEVDFVQAMLINLLADYRAMRSVVEAVKLKHDREHVGLLIEGDGIEFCDDPVCEAVAVLYKEGP